MKPRIKIYYYFLDENNIEHSLPINLLISIVLKMVIYVCQADWSTISYSGLNKTYLVRDRITNEVSETSLAEWVKNGLKDISIEECLSIENYYNKTNYIKEKTPLLYFEDIINNIYFFVVEPFTEEEDNL